MTIRHMRIFIAVADHGKMSTAAQALYMTQPSISQAIGEIEREYDVKVFERLARRLYITEAGSHLLDYARHIVSLYDEMEASVRNLGQGLQLRIGATVTVGTCVIGDIIDAFEKKFPKNKPQVLIDNTDSIERKILESSLDVALVEGLVKSPELICQPVMEDELVLVCGRNHPFWGRKNLDSADLQGVPFILREKGSGTRELFENRLREKNIVVEEGWVSNNSEAIKNAAIRGYGPTVISKRLVEKELEGQSLRIIPIRDMSMKRQFRLIYHKNKYISASMQEFINLCIKIQHAGKAER